MPARKLDSRFMESLEAFREGLYRELEAQRERAHRTDIRVAFLESLESRNGKYRASFLADRSSEQLTPGVTGKLVTEDEAEFDVRLTQVEDREIVLTSEVQLNKKEYRLSLTPWFLFERLQSQLESLGKGAVDSQVEAALESFGVTPARSFPARGFHSSLLNESQNEAVENSLCHSASRIWGPPGTGKTTTLAVLVTELVRRGERILLTSNTHAALDQVLHGLTQRPGLQNLIDDGRVLRLGRTLPEHRHCQLSDVTKRLHTQLRHRWEKAESRLAYVRGRMEKIEKPLRDLQIATGPSEQLSLFESPEPQGLPTDWLKSVLGERRGQQWSRLAPSYQCELLELHMKRLGLLRKAHSNRIADCREALAERQQQTVSRATIILSTLANLTTSRWMEGERFDNVIVEEAGMAILPAFFVACTRAERRTVAVGDPRQLPSILTSRDSFVRHALGRNIFEIGEAPKAMLTTQYRMHPEIGELVSYLAYDGQLKHARGAEEFEEWTKRDPLEGGAVAGFDLQGSSVCQKLPGQSSRFNEASAGVCLKLAQRAIDAGFVEVAIITPYRQQVRTLRKSLPDEMRHIVECDTVHRYQGKERAVVIVDLVDGEAFGPGTLLRDERGAAAQLLNVALSRAQFKLFLVGELNYLCRQIPHSFVGRAVTYLAKKKKLFKVKI
jgi:AAA domain